jgi:galactofuranose transport system permease protein
MLMKNSLSISRMSGVIFTKYGAVIALLALLLFNGLFTDNFLNWATFSNLFTQGTKVALVALGMTLVIATGGIDISVGSAMGLGAVISAIAIVNGNPWVILLSLVVVIGFSLLAGTLTSKLGILPLVSTLALMYIMRGLARGISGRGQLLIQLPN